MQLQISIVSTRPSYSLLASNYKYPIVSTRQGPFSSGIQLQISNSLNSTRSILFWHPTTNIQYLNSTNPFSSGIQLQISNSLSTRPSLFSSGIQLHQYPIVFNSNYTYPFSRQPILFNCKYPIVSTRPKPILFWHANIQYWKYPMSTKPISSGIQLQIKVSTIQGLFSSGIQLQISNPIESLLTFSTRPSLFSSGIQLQISNSLNSTKPHSLLASNYKYPIVSTRPKSLQISIVSTRPSLFSSDIQLNSLNSGYSLPSNYKYPIVSTRPSLILFWHPTTNIQPILFWHPTTKYPIVSTRPSLFSSGIQLQISNSLNSTKPVLFWHPILVSNSLNSTRPILFWHPTTNINSLNSTKVHSLLASNCKYPIVSTRPSLFSSGIQLQISNSLNSTKPILLASNHKYPIVSTRPSLFSSGIQLSNIQYLNSTKPLFSSGASNCKYPIVSNSTRLLLFWHPTTKHPIVSNSLSLFSSGIQLQISIVSTRPTLFYSDIQLQISNSLNSTKPYSLLASNYKNINSLQLDQAYSLLASNYKFSTRPSLFFSGIQLQTSNSLNSTKPILFWHPTTNIQSTLTHSLLASRQLDPRPPIPQMSPTLILFWLNYKYPIVSTRQGPFLQHQLQYPIVSTRQAYSLLASATNVNSLNSTKPILFWHPTTNIQYPFSSGIQPQISIVSNSTGPILFWHPTTNINSLQLDQAILFCILFCPTTNINSLNSTKPILFWHPTTNIQYLSAKPCSLLDKYQYSSSGVNYKYPIVSTRPVHSLLASNYKYPIVSTRPSLFSSGIQLQISNSLQLDQSPTRPSLFSSGINYKHPIVLNSTKPILLASNYKYPISPTRPSPILFWHPNIKVSNSNSLSSSTNSTYSLLASNYKYPIVSTRPSPCILFHQLQIIRPGLGSSKPILFWHPTKISNSPTRPSLFLLASNYKYPISNSTKPILLLHPTTNINSLNSTRSILFWHPTRPSLFSSDINCKYPIVSRPSLFSSGSNRSYSLLASNYKYPIVSTHKPYSLLASNCKYQYLNSHPTTTSNSPNSTKPILFWQISNLKHPKYPQSPTDQPIPSGIQPQISNSPNRPPILFWHPTKYPIVPTRPGPFSSGIQPQISPSQLDQPYSLLASINYKYPWSQLDQAYSLLASNYKYPIVSTRPRPILF
ncbi:unnamed protein product [Acanthosepion pharaonis]|uniref:Uncharacterized protein n=1 Tax=Acanthosepion pharaonis TaxID=158019 RepID=A0A812DUW7_ACAPH|nr:unnamed protein product [Sepia pharaonis]